MQRKPSSLVPCTNFPQVSQFFVSNFLSFLVPYSKFFPLSFSVLCPNFSELLSSLSQFPPVSRFFVPIVPVSVFFVPIFSSFSVLCLNFPHFLSSLSQFSPVSRFFVPIAISRYGTGAYHCLMKTKGLSSN